MIAEYSALDVAIGATSQLTLEDGYKSRVNERSYKTRKINHSHTPI